MGWCEYQVLAGTQFRSWLSGPRCPRWRRWLGGRERGQAVLPGGPHWAGGGGQGKSDPITCPLGLVAGGPPRSEPARRPQAHCFFCALCLSWQACKLASRCQPPRGALTADPLVTAWALRNALKRQHIADIGGRAARRVLAPIIRQCRCAGCRSRPKPATRDSKLVTGAVHGGGAWHLARRWLAQHRARPRPPSSLLGLPSGRR